MKNELSKNEQPCTTHSVISRYLLEVSEKHNIPIERLMCGVLQNDFYVWDYDSGRSYDSQFIVVGIFPL